MSYNMTNIASLLEAMNNQGITNKYLQAGILSVIGKETNFKPVRENMNYTSSDRLLQVFPSYFSTVSDTLPYLNNPEKLANYVYGNRGGNYLPDDGYSFRGGTYNQVTFRNTYKKIGDQLGIDLVGNPDKINDADIAAKISIQYFINSLNSSSGKNKLLSTYGVNDFNSIPDLNTGVLVAVNSNAGWGKNVYSVLGLDSAQKLAPEMLKLVESGVDLKKKF